MYSYKFYFLLIAYIFSTVIVAKQERLKRNPDRFQIASVWPLYFLWWALNEIIAPIVYIITKFLGGLLAPVTETLYSLVYKRK